MRASEPVPDSEEEERDEAVARKQNDIRQSGRRFRLRKTTSDFCDISSETKANSEEVLVPYRDIF